LQANVDRAVGRRQALRWAFSEGGRALEQAEGGTGVSELDAVDLFRRWEELCFEALVAASFHR